MSESSEHYMSDGMNEHDQLRALAVENQRLRAQLAEQPAVTTCDREHHYTGDSEIPDGPCDCPKGH